MRSLFLLFIFFTSLFAISPSQALQAVKANPALLNTPQAQQIMREKGITKEQVLQKIGQSSATKQETSRVQVENKVATKTQAEATQVLLAKKPTPTVKPLHFIDEAKLIKKIRSIQQKVTKIKLHRFGEKFFYNKNSLNQQILAVPEYYQLNPKDIVTIQIFGGEDKSFSLTVDNYGNIDLPVIGPVHVSGLSVAEIKKLITKKLQPTYPNATIVVNVKVNSFIQVSLTGYVPAPGIYNLQSLSTVKDLLIAANGFGAIGSMREVYLKRNGKTLKIIDFYKLIKDGDIVDTTLLRNGDIIYVPKAKNLVKLYGDVYTPAIYELKSGEKVKDLISFSGGLKPTASKKDIKIKRFEKNSFSKIYIVDIDSKMALKDGDEVYVYKISELQRDFVYVYGNIEKPGTFAIPKDKSLKSLLSKLSYLKDTYYDYGLLERFEGNIISFNLKSPKNITLKPKDTIYIFNKYEVLPEEYILIQGKVVKNPGRYRYKPGMTLTDVVNTAGFTRPFDVYRVQIVSYDENLRPYVKFVDYTKHPNYPIQEYDEITFFDYYNFNPLKPFTVRGEVNNPNTFIYAKNLTLKSALQMAGWLTDRADKNYIEINRYKIVNGERKRFIKRVTLKDLDFKIEPYDEIYVKRIPKWYERKTVTISGEVKYPGTYTIEEGETLASVLKRAGGFTKKAYLYAAVFTRKSIQKLQEKSIKDMIYRLRKKASVIMASNKGIGEQGLETKDMLEAINMLAKEASKLKPIGRVAIKLDRDLEKFAESPYNVKLQDGDKLYIPIQSDTITVSGEVLTPNAFVYNSSNALDYIKKAGGLTKDADDIYFVVHANGFSEKGEIGSWFTKGVKVKPGDAIVVPILIKTYSNYSIARDLTDIVYKLSITAASLKTVGAL